MGGISLIAAIPLSAIAGGIPGLSGLLVAWAGIVGVNAAQALGRHLAERPEKRGSEDAWEG